MTCARQRRATARSSRMSPALTSSAPAIVCRALVDAMNSSTLMCLLLLMSTPDCATHSPAAAEPNAPPAPGAAENPHAASSSPSNIRNGDLVVYSATYSQTLEQSEYPAHTNYTIATVDDHVIEHVTNATGTFNSRPARVSLPAGEYHVRAQYGRGGFVIVPVVIEPGKITVVDLDGAAIPRHPSAQPSDPSHQKQYDNDHQHQSQPTTGSVAPTAAMRPPREGSDQHQYQNDQQNGSQSHGLLLGAPLHGALGA
jgi:hypothetical protein